MSLATLALFEPWARASNFYKQKLCYNNYMSKNEEMISFVDSSQRLEGMNLSAREKQTMRDCLTDKTTYKKALRSALARHKKAAF